QPGAPRRSRGVIAAIVTAIGLALAKGKVALLFLLGKFKLLFVAFKLKSLAITGYTMVLAAWVYAKFYGWPYAVELVLLILIHGLGHGAAAASVNLAVGAPVFVPFFGAYIALKEQVRSTWQEFIVAAGGPLVGATAAGACFALGVALDSGFLRVLGFSALA